jgi:hypothetical protein
MESTTNERLLDSLGGGPQHSVSKKENNMRNNEEKQLNDIDKRVSIGLDNVGNSVSNKE